MTVYRYIIQERRQSYMDVVAETEDEANDKVKETMDMKPEVESWWVLDVEELKVKVEDANV